MDRDRLLAIIRQRSFRQGGAFRLASGRTSSIYFNLKPTMLDAHGAALIGEAVAAKAAELGADLVGGLEMGAVPIASAAAAMSATPDPGVAGRPVSAIFVRKAAKEHGTQSLIEGLADGETLAGRRVLVVEDVTTTGGSALKAVAVLREAGAIVTDVITIVNREEGATEAFAAAHVTLHALFVKSDFAADSAG